MQHEAHIAQLVLIVLIAAFLVAIRRQVFVPIADGDPARGPAVLPSNEEDDDAEEEALQLQPVRVRHSRGFLRFGLLPFAVLLVAALRIACLVAFQR